MTLIFSFLSKNAIYCGFYVHSPKIYNRLFLIGPFSKFSYRYSKDLGKIFHSKHASLHRHLHTNVTNYESRNKKTEDWNDIVNRWYKNYQDFVGLTDILQAQENVTDLTNSLLECQSLRRRLQLDVENIHHKLLSVHQSITKAELYSEEHYSLFEQARQQNSKLKSVQEEFVQSEEKERMVFSQLSAAIKHCHEKERTYAEQSKYWSVLISVVSAALASLITSINNWVRIREIKDHSTSLHKKILSKYEAFELSISHLIKMKLDKDDIIGETVKSELESFKSELESFFKSLEFERQISPPSGTSQSDFTYARIALAMSAGTALGVIGTAFIIHFFGFGS